ncbi:type-F conjugative transfer system mating-pair stabilization protein TraN [Klebsiella aerogenes]|uniref:type-F conjugative transfer system mating-pair stabilization protein TraN n=1 Tax=Klebsiella aerogenes TaxID=548 RepID=UPI002E36C09A|nr:type-F conjugative transfer system mating-pair stabilization protein TraN [Klebsiella aerogenes]MED7793168.1 type-F conjugative transfer system mating-pair stabilization protein TraN [Klebsiella aerogenes]
MKLTPWFPLLLLAMCSSAHSAKEFDEGMSWAKQHQSQGTGAITGFTPSASLPGYTDDPDQKQYYGGVTDGGGDLTTPGMNEMTNTDNGRAITDAVIAIPSDNTPSLDAPFIASGTDMQTKADTVTQGSDVCTPQNATFNELTNYTCTRDTTVEQACTRTASVTGHEEDEVVMKTLTVPTSSFQVSYDGDKGVNFTFPSPATGIVLSASLRFTVNDTVDYYAIDYWGASKEFLSKDITLTLPGAVNANLTAGALTPWGKLTSKACLSGRQERCREYAKKTVSWLGTGKATLTVTLQMRVHSKKWVPDVVWSESCPFSKAEGVMVASECTSPGGTRTFYHNGQAVQVTQDCWAWRDTYTTQKETEGTCGEYIHNPACTLSSRRCIDAPDGMCVTNQETWSCETKIAGKGQVCGGTFFCTDGACAQGETGTSHMFGQAVSSLAAVAAAGKDVAELNGENVRAFTGKGMSCKKFAAGFNNCCKDSGWGADAGLSSCSSEEKALGKAKEKKLTVYVGEYCSKKVLGVCLEKKRGYCQFDSKLARIVQEQGRKGQLGIGFGSGSSPDCRGITIDELQRLKFDIMDFSDFYSDLENGTTIPQDNALLQKAQDIIAQKMKEAGK